MMEQDSNLLDHIDKELRNISELYSEAGALPSGKKLLKTIKDKRKKFSTPQAATAVISLLVLVFSLCLSSTIYSTMLPYLRVLMLHVLPWWDWTQLYASECLVDNPFFVGTQLEAKDCELCEHLTSIPRLSAVSPNVIAENYLKQDRPFIVTDAIAEWPAKKHFNVQFLNQLHSMDESLRDYAPCSFRTNIKNVIAKQILSKADANLVTNFYAHWENCGRPAAKLIRDFYDRPYFLPHMVEMADTNWLFVAVDYEGKQYKPADLGLPMMFIAVLQGQMKVSLSPRQPCNTTCRILYATLDPGEIIVYTDFLWFFDYLPVGHGSTIAIGAGGYFD